MAQGGTRRVRQPQPVTQDTPRAAACAILPGASPGVPAKGRAETYPRNLIRVIPAEGA
ncbi:hypothetical protein GCM10008956_20240 [Deinococcus arenae]|uniref:Uncharacterized protein n=1 Tax=Deinococcus arenae TaxID=1452751 RepID=A0A8H9GTK1_9DEIO|nr:hypothetical protein GCM10008956_20240 [Deinococcus arenae]